MAQTGNIPSRLPDPKRGEYTLAWSILAWCERYIRQPDGENAGVPWRFTREQVHFLVWYYAVDSRGKWLYRSASLRRSKGWGKSPVLAALALIEFIGPCRFSHFVDMPDGTRQPVGRSVAAPWVQVAATAIHQTANTLEMIRGMLVASPAIQDYNIDVGKTVIQFSDGRPGKIEPVTSNSETLEGGRPTFAVLDETHLWHETNGGHKVFRVIGRNLGKNPGGLARFVESTNAFNPTQDSVAQRTYDAVQAGSKGILYDCREAGPHVDLSDETSLREALAEAYGDSTWVDHDRVVEEINDPRTPESDAYRFYLNNIKETADTWIEKWAWDACARDDDPLLPKDQIALGFDGSVRNDSTALVASRLRDGKLFILGLWESDGTPDWEVDVLAVDARVAEIFKSYRVEWMYADPYYWQTTVGNWALEFGDKIVFEFATNRDRAMAEAVERFHTDTYQESLSHDGGLDLSRHIANCRTRETRNGYVLTKESPKSKKKIDAAIAAVLAYEARADALADGRLKRRKKILGL
ncbi:hypothetical protein ABZV14_05730 [Streptosporangium canum]|uniref:hypothetical protein n=1 Tax=Streptosporangium canum TaxID=324952 RepID=UPI0033A91B6B